jgi:hypothetical protein
MSVRQDILAEILSRVATIDVSQGFQTDAGRQVFFGESPQLGPDDPEAAIAVVVRDDFSTDQSGFGEGEDGISVALLPIEIQGVVKADLEQPWVTVEQIISDIKRAVETSDRGLGGLLAVALARGRTRTQHREPGSTIVGASIEYRAIVAESWGGGAV